MQMASQVQTSRVVVEVKEVMHKKSGPRQLHLAGLVVEAGQRVGSRMIPQDAHFLIFRCETHLT